MTLRSADRMGLVPGTSQLRITLYDGVRFEKGVLAGHGYVEDRVGKCMYVSCLIIKYYVATL